jgi:hypothetical protein
MKTRTLLATVALVLFAVHSKADAIPHQSVVSAALAKTFAVSATGNVTGPFPEGRAASGSDMEDVYDSSELRPSWIGGLPQSSPLKTFTYTAKQLFDSRDSAKLKNGSQLDPSGRFLAENQFGFAIVVASSGMDGDARDRKDMVLAEARALVVRKYLDANFGFDNGQLKSLGLGKQAGSHRDADWGLVQILIFPAGTGIPSDSPAAAVGSYVDPSSYGEVLDPAPGTDSAWFFDNQTNAAGAPENSGYLGAGSAPQFGYAGAGSVAESEPSNPVLGVFLSSNPANIAGGLNSVNSTVSAGDIPNTSPSPDYVHWHPIRAGGWPLILEIGQPFDNGDNDGSSTSCPDPAAVTPEPGSFYLLGTGLLALIGIGRRKLRA